MKILVTGHKGFIGKNMVKALEKDHTVVGYEWGEGKYDLTDVNLVIHLGAISSTTYTDTRQLLIQNLYFTEKLILECCDRGIPIQIASSASVYGTENQTFCESDPPAPKNYYAFSKLMVEEYCNTHEFPIPVQLFRYFNVYGPGEDHKGNQASPYHQFTKQAIENKVIRVFEGSEEFKRDFVPVERVIDVHKKFFDIPMTGIWNLGTGTSTSFMEVAKEVALKHHATIQTIPMPDNLKSSYQKFTKANLTNLNEVLSQYGKLWKIWKRR